MSFIVCIQIHDLLFSKVTLGQCLHPVCETVTTVLTSQAEENETHDAQKVLTQCCTHSTAL